MIYRLTLRLGEEEETEEAYDLFRRRRSTVFNEVLETSSDSTRNTVDCSHSQQSTMCENRFSHLASGQCLFHAHRSRAQASRCHHIHLDQIY